MRKLNVKRMQKYVYRSFPDRYELHINWTDQSNDEMKRIMDEALADFMVKMAIKHQGKNVNVDVWQDEWLMRNPSEIVYVFQARPHDRGMTIVNTPPTPRRSP